MKIDEQHLLPEHLAFYRRRWFWGVVLFLIFVINNIYIIFEYGFSLETSIFPNIIFPVLVIGGLASSETIGIASSLVLYSALLYFSLFRKTINYYTLAALIILAILSVISLSNFTGG